MADLIEAAAGADIVAIQMRFFGDSGLTRLGDGLVIEQLVQASREDFEKNDIVKSLARNKLAFVKITANHMPVFEPPVTPRIFNGGGAEIPREAYGGRRFQNVPQAWRDMSVVQLNHYAVRTAADFRAKIHRGDATLNPKRFTRAYFDSRNRNDERDTSIQRFVPEVRALMAQWLSDPVLAARNRRCFEAYAEIVSQAEGSM